MRKFGIVIIVLLGTMQFTVPQSFAQQKFISTASPNASAVPTVQTPTPTPNNITPTTTPIPTIVPTNTPAVVTPTPQVTQKSSATPTTNTVQPTPTPGLVPPLQVTSIPPPPKPHPVAVIVKKPTPPPPVSKLIEAPLALAKTILPNRYYNEQRLDPQTTKILFLFSLASILLGALLLAWPALVLLKNRLFAAFHKKDPVGYLHNGKGILKAI